MAIEIEKKFLLSGQQWKQGDEGIFYRQGYLSSTKERTVRVRTCGNKGFLTIKGISKGAARLEFEYEIPFEEAATLLAEICKKPLIEKIRYRIEYRGFIWEVDEFLGENKGLVIAEIELDAEEQPFEKPAWVGEEVTGDPRYYNANLIMQPFSSWK